MANHAASVLTLLLLVNIVLEVLREGKWTPVAGEGVSLASFVASRGSVEIRSLSADRGHFQHCFLLSLIQGVLPG